MRIRDIVTLLLFSTITNGMEITPGNHEKADDLALQMISNLSQIFPAEIWDRVFDYLHLPDQSKLATVNSYFRDNFF